MIMCNCYSRYVLDYLCDCGADGARQASALNTLMTTKSLFKGLKKKQDLLRCTTYLLHRASVDLMWEGLQQQALALTPRH